MTFCSSEIPIHLMRWTSISNSMFVCANLNRLPKEKELKLSPNFSDSKATQPNKSNDINSIYAWSVWVVRMNDGRKCVFLSIKCFQFFIGFPIPYLSCCQKNNNFFSCFGVNQFISDISMWAKLLLTMCLLLLFSFHPRYLLLYNIWVYCFHFLCLPKPCHGNVVINSIRVLFSVNRNGNW